MPRESRYEPIEHTCEASWSRVCQCPQPSFSVTEVTQEKRNDSDGIHTRNLSQRLRAHAHHAPRNEHMSRPEADRIDVVPHAERCVCLLLRNDAVQSQAKSRRCSFHFARNRRRR